MAEVAKALQERKAAKAKFTRKKNAFFTAVAKKENMGDIEGNFNELTKAWRDVEGKHDNYIILLEGDEAPEKEEAWINELQNTYSDANSVYNRCASENLLKAKEDEMSAKFEGLAKKKASLEAMFKSSFEQVKGLLTPDSTGTIATASLKKCECDLATIFNDCKSLHDDIIELPLEARYIETEIEWIRKLHAQYSDIASQVEYYSDENLAKQRIKPEQINYLQMEKAKLPTFNGDIRNYPRFKSDFMKYVLPTTNQTSAPYILRSCLTGEPLESIKSVDDNLDEMWARLDEKYGDPTKITDVVINAIQNCKPIKEGESRKLLEFITTVEDGYRDLKRLGLQSEITTTSSVSIIERKLPNDIKKEWSKIVCSTTIDKSDKFSNLLTFLLEQRKIIEYETSELRATNQSTEEATNYVSATEKATNSEGKRSTSPIKCIIHEKGTHGTSECKVFLAKTVEERKQTLKDKKACWSCLRTGHRYKDCKRKNACGKNGCTYKHHQTLHEDKALTKSVTPSGVSGTINACQQFEKSACIFQVQRIRTKKSWMNVMWDSAASLCFITNEKAKAEKLQGKEVELTITKVGGETEKLQTYKYNLPLIDLKGDQVILEVYGIDKITNDIQGIESTFIASMFNNVLQKDINRPEGKVDVLIGYQYAAYHPQKEQNNGHLLLLENRFGKCVGGSHPMIKETTQRLNEIVDAKIHLVDTISINDFYQIENLGIECNPKCGGCKCGKCAIGSKNYSLREERELHLIENNLKYDKENKRWIAQYPWVKDPNDLPDNRRVAVAKLISTEKRLAKNRKHAETYELQIQDMLDRNVARKLIPEELATYRGPIHYISHHEVLKPDSKTTPVRIVFNSSANFMGHVLNEYWAKGPDLLNSLIGILIRFRENEIAFIGDVRKMYHTVYTKELDQHTHRFLWRNMDTTRQPDTYVIQRVSFGDKPSGGIATVAMRKTAEFGHQEFPEATKTIINNSYMDDIIDSVNNKERAKSITRQIESVLEKGGFKMKEWIYSDDQLASEESILPSPTEKVLGITWSPSTDQLQFKVKMSLSPKKKRKTTHPILENSISNLLESLTKRAILSQVNSIYDPLGLAGPFTIRAKILMRELWIKEPNLGWDETIPPDYKRAWSTFFKDMNEMNSVINKRCLKPENCEGDPILVIFSDGSKDAYGACAYIRWHTTDGEYDSQLLLSKNRLAPLKNISIDRIELCAAVINKRLKQTILNECRYKFEHIYHIVDSQIVHAMIRKETYGFNTFAATRVGEIQEGTQISDWYWIPGENNIADWLTRGKSPNDIGMDSKWQKGPPFLKQPESEWPISQCITKQPLPDTITQGIANVITAKEPQDTIATRINIQRYSSYTKLLRVTARILAIYKKSPKTSFKNATKQLLYEDILTAETFWIIQVQQEMESDIQQGRYKRLCVRKREDQIYVVGHRTQRWVEMSYNKSELILLSYKHRFSRLYVEYIHQMGHLGVSATACKVRAKFWIVKLHKLVKSIKSKCVTCRKIETKTNQQVMGQLPEERLKPSPAWNSTAIDLFGPFKIRDEVKKRTFGKAYGVIFNCLSSRAVHIDIAPDYSTETFLMVFRRFVSLRGYPTQLYSDNGPQLVSANNELLNITKNFNQEQLQTFGVVEGFQWKFTPADAPWQNGISEALIKTVKRALTLAIGDNTLTFSELQTVCYEVANLVNERPIGRHPTSPEDGTYLSPNDLLLGRSSSRIPSGPFKEHLTLRQRFEFVQSIINRFWKKWISDYFPSLIIRQKWHTATRNVRVGDIVLVADSNVVRGEWKLARVNETFPGKDGQVRKVTLKYKNPRPREPIRQYKGHGFVTIDRPVHKLVVLVPIEEQNS